MEEILSFFIFDQTQTIILSVFAFIFVIQLYYYIFHYRVPLSHYKKELESENKVTNKPSVSVIIVAKNESENLENNLPLILKQDYPNFEVIVVNDGSTDESDCLLKRLELENDHLYHTFLPVSRDRVFGRKKLAMTIGVKASKNEVLLFTEADCVPDSDRWISTMMENMDNNIDVVIGYSYYQRQPSLYQRVARFDNLIFSLQYFSKSIKDKAFIGTYRNIAFRRNLFFDNKGFSSFLNIENGEDVFLNEIILDQESVSCLNPDAFVSSELLFSRWREIKTSYMRAKKFFRGMAHHSFALETLTRYLYYLGFAGALAYGIICSQWGVVSIVSLLFLIKQITQIVILNKARKHFKSSPLFFSLFWMEMIQPIYNAYFNSTSRVSKKQRY